MKTAEKRSLILSALAHPLRLKLVETLLQEGTQNVTALIERVNRSQALVSKHLRVLRDAGVVRCTPDGRCRGYEVTSPDTVAALIAVIEQFDALRDPETEENNELAEHH